MNPDIKTLNTIYNSIRKNTKNKKKIYYFEINKMQNLEDIMSKFPTYQGGNYHIFLCKDPKVRLIMSQDIKDKIINHYIAYFLQEKLEKYLDFRNIATRKNKGTSFGIKLLKKYLEQNKKYEKFYILKIDIEKYFYKIDHQVLKDLLQEKLEEKDFKIVEKVIDSTNQNYIKEKVNLFRKYYDLPVYTYGKGLPLGNRTSQVFSIFYLSKLDHKIIYDLKIKHYIRYMDDFILIHPSKQYLQYCLEEIKKELQEKYQLKIHRKKTEIKSSKEWCEFLGYRFKIQGKKTIFLIRNSTLKRMKKKIKELKRKQKNKEIKENQVFSSLMNMQYGFLSSYNKRKRIINSFYEK